MKYRILPILLAIITGASLLTACSSEKNTATADEAVNRVYPEGEGKLFDPSAVATEVTESTAATEAATTQAATKGKSSKQKTTKPRSTDPTDTQPTTIQANVPADNITGANINPNLGYIQSQVAARIEALAVKSISLSASNLTLEAGESKELTISFNPSDAAIKSCSMKLNNSNATATLSGTTVTVKGEKAGTATLTVTSHNGHSATCDIIVKRAEQAITDDTVLNHGELCTAENANRWCEAVTAHLSALGMKHNTSLSGASAEISTAGLNNLSYNSAENELVAQAESELSAQTDGRWGEYDFNCFAETNGGEYVIVVVMNEAE